MIKHQNLTHESKRNELRRKLRLKRKSCDEFDLKVKKEHEKAKRWPESLK